MSMGLRRLTPPIIFAFLLFSQVFAQDLEVKPDNKDANVAGAADAKYSYRHGPHYGRGPYYGHRPPYCGHYCGRRCCSAEEFAAFSQAADHVDEYDFSDDKRFGPYRPGPRYPPYFRPPHCRYLCGRSRAGAAPLRSMWSLCRQGTS